MNKFKVIDPKGFSFGGKVLKKGDTFDAENKSAHIQTGLHFKQITETKSEDPEAAAKVKAEKEKAEADARAKEDAEAKAKADAAAKDKK